MKENSNITLYHCTTDAWKDSILNKGLLLCKSQSELNGEKSIFLSISPKHIFGNTCIKVVIPKRWVKQTVNTWKFICNKNIPSENISFYSYEEDE